MAPSSGLRVVALGLLGVMMAMSQAWGATLKVGGTGAVTELLRQLGPPFTAETGIVLDVIPGMGSSGAASAAADGKLGIAFSSRQLRDKEKARGLNQVAAFTTPFGLVTSRASPESLKRSEIAALYRSDRPRWPDGTPILITLRPTDESDNILLGEFFPGMAEALLHLRKNRSDLSIAATDQDNADLAEKVQGSLTAASLAQVISEKRNLRFVMIDGVAATLENYRNGSYPYGKPLYAIVPSAISPEAQAFVAFLAKPATEALLREAGIVAGK
jgi:phosphate transport system substrate-binding protein